MGKIKSPKQKLEEPVSKSKKTIQFKTKKSTNITKNKNLATISKSTIRLLSSNQNLLEQTTPIINLKNNKTDDNPNVKSKPKRESRISKKDKLKLRHTVLLQKMDAVNQLKKKHKERVKRKNISIIGDTNPLHDALPSLESLLKKRHDIKHKVTSETAKKKAIPKTRKRQKNVVQGVDMFKKLLSNKKYQNDPLNVISEHVKRRLNAGEL